MHEGVDDEHAEWALLRVRQNRGDVVHRVDQNLVRRDARVQHILHHLVLLKLEALLSHLCHALGSEAAFGIEEDDLAVGAAVLGAKLRLHAEVVEQLGLRADEKQRREGGFEEAAGSTRAPTLPVRNSP